MPIRIDQQDGWLEFDVKVIPGASRDRIVGVYDGRLKVSVAQPPEGGAANRAVIELLARALGVARRDVELLRGHTSPLKTLRVRGATAERVQALIG